MFKINPKNILIISLLFIFPLFLTACTKSTVQQQSSSSTEKKSTSEFPLPKDVKNITDLGNSTITFQTNLKLQESLDFYRKEFAQINLTERQVNTAITDTTFSLVFDGSKNNMAIVIQGVTIGEKTNISIRYEKI